MVFSGVLEDVTDSLQGFCQNVFVSYDIELTKQRLNFLNALPSYIWGILAGPLGNERLRRSAILSNKKNFGSAPEDYHYTLIAFRYGIHQWVSMVTIIDEFHI